MIDTPTDKAAEIMRHYGAEQQLTILCEECAELIQQACKCRRRGIAMHDDMIEEMADVKIMLMQFESVMKLSERALLDRTVAEKLDRQLERMRENHESSNF